MRIIAAALVLVLCACASSLQTGGAVDGVSLGAAPAASPDSIVLTLRNGSAQPVGYNLCTATVERLANDSWQNIATDRVCTMELRTLEPGGQATFTTTLPAGAPGGDYRFVAGVHIPTDGERVTLTSNVLRVAS